MPLEQLSRRSFLTRGLPAAAASGLAFGAALSEIKDHAFGAASDILASLAQSDDPLTKEPTTDSGVFVGPEDPRSLTEKLFAKILLKHPAAAQNPFLLFSLHDQDVYAFLEMCSVADLEGITNIKMKERFENLLNTEKMWQKVVRHDNKRAPYSAYAKSTPDENLSFSGLLAETQRTLQTMRTSVLPAAGLGNGFGKYLHAELLMAIFIQEVGPSRGKEGLTPKGRVELFRMLLESGFQPQKIPSLTDNEVSFGLAQMWQRTHERLQRGYGSTTENYIEPNFWNHMNSIQQIRNAGLLAFSNMARFWELSSKHEHFMGVFEKAGEEEQGQFLAPVLAAYHNFGDRHELTRAVNKTLKQELENLEAYRNAFLDSLKKLRTARGHAENVTALYSALKNRGAGKTLEEPREDDITMVTSPLDEKADSASEVTEDMLTVRVKKHPKTKQLMPYYSFIVPPNIVACDIANEMLAEGKTLDDAIKFQGISEVQPGEPLLIPISYLQKDLQNRRFSRIPLTNTSFIAAMDEYLKDGASCRNYLLAILYGSNDKALLMPTSLLKEEPSPFTSSLPKVWMFPTDGEITSIYGEKRANGKIHYGIDIANRSKPDVFATADGMVVRVIKNCGAREKENRDWCMEGYGNLVVIDHGCGVETRYGHFASVKVNNGQRVTAGEKIGTMGNSGSSRGETGLHVHFELRINGRTVDPAPFLGV